MTKITVNLSDEIVNKIGDTLRAKYGVVITSKRETMSYLYFFIVRQIGNLVAKEVKK